MKPSTDIDIERQDREPKIQNGSTSTNEETASSTHGEETFSMDDSSLPIFNYNRNNGDNIPHIFSSGAYSSLASYAPNADARVADAAVPQCTCSQIGRILLTRRDDGTIDECSELDNQPIALIGYSDGTVAFFHAETGTTIVDSKYLQVTAPGGQQRSEIVDVTVDATANYFAAINASGCCAIWEALYTNGKTNESVVTPDSEPSDNLFKTFLTSLAGQSNTNNTNQPLPVESSHVSKNVSVQVSRILYSLGRPTCLVIDPAYKSRREKMLLVAFADGRLVLTKRGFVFQRRNDVILYQAPSGQRVEALTWRGSLVAWADISGIKLFDVETMTRIAHVDRPSGARAALYPTISDLKPTLCFETSSSLLVAWGDCVMAMTIQESIVRTSNDDTTPVSAANSRPASDQTVQKRRHVGCTMAWELDCVACGIAPLDENHLLILGLVANDESDRSPGDPLNDVELQVISRSEGTVIYADVIPVVRWHDQGVSVTGDFTNESAGVYSLLSTFSIPRMEDTMEADAEGVSVDKDFDFTLFSNTTSKPFVDMHLRWNLDALDFDGKSVDDAPADEDKADDDSEDYGFLFRQASNAENLPKWSGSIPPVLMVTAPSDLVTIRTRTIDDAISHALYRNKPALALKRALRYKRQLREYDIDELVDAYLKAILCIDEGDESQRRQRLSIHRLELATKSTPILLGGNAQRWQYWTEKFSCIPGALFVLWDHLPVRDPKLPPEFYTELLKQLLEEIERMLQPETNNDEMALASDLMNHAFQQFLCAVCAWGPTHALREKVRFHKHFLNQKPWKHSTILNHTLRDPILRSHEHALYQRMTQSASCFLQYPPTLKSSMNITEEESFSTNPEPATLDSKPDSLFDVKKMISLVSLRVPFMRSNQKNFDELGMNSKICLEALAELNHMLLKYEETLKCYLVMAVLFPRESLASIETKALTCANQVEISIDCHEKDEAPSYGFVLSLIEQHHLHGSLMDSELLNVVKERMPLVTPLISLILLIGLDPVGDFLIDHCVPPPRHSKYDIPDSTASSVSSADSQVSRVSRDGNESLPINFVSEQLRSSPPILYWYLQLVFIKRPEMYVIFPTTAVPPRAITELHRAHLELHIEYAKDRDSAISLLGTEVYNQERKTTSLLNFLKSALSLGGIHSDEIRTLLTNKRSESLEHDSENSHLFALELAYVIENYGNRSEEEAQQILSLYLNGAKSVMLAASYAQRNKDHSKVLWETLIEYCLLGGDGQLDDVTHSVADGTLFGTLLEAAALCGADLARLVTSIPEGMNIEGLRPRLVAAVADYRMKLSMHQAATDICKTDRITLLRELGHRSRRGVRHIGTERHTSSASEHEVQNILTQSSTSNHTRKIVIRPSRHRLSVRLAMR